MSFGIEDDFSIFINFSLISFFLFFLKSLFVFTRKEIRWFHSNFLNNGFKGTSSMTIDQDGILVGFFMRYNGNA